MIVVGFGIIESFWKIQQNSILEQGGSLVNLSYSNEESILLTSDKRTDGIMEQETLFDNLGIVNENDMDSDFVISIWKVLILAAMFTYLMLYYSVCQALFILLMLTVKQAGNEFRKTLKREGYQDDENGNDGLNKVRYTT